MKADPALSQLLAEIGLMAAGYGLNEHAEAILAAVQDSDAASGAPAIGRAIMLMNNGRHDEAARSLERSLEAVGQRDRAAVEAIRGWALQKAGLGAESERVLKRVADGEGGPAELATALLAGNGRR